SLENRAGERAARREVPLARATCRAGTDLHGTSRSGRALPLSALLPLPALRRHAAARRHRPRAGAPSADPPDGRAVQRARRHDAGRAAGSAAEDLGRSRADHPVRHPRPRRGALSRPARHPAQRLARHHRRRGISAARLSAPADRDPQRPALSRAARAALSRHGRAGHGRTGGPMIPRLRSLLRDTRVSGVILILLLLAAWQLSATYVVTSPTWPKVTRIFEAWWDNVIDGTLPGHLLATFWRMMLGYGLAIVLGITLGLVMGYYRALYNLFEPLVEVLRPIPGPAYLPLLVLFVGIGHEMKVTLILVASLFPILLNTYSRVRSIGPV